MANPLVILQRSGIPEGTKVATMVAEIRRRWKNTWLGASKATYEEITKSFMDDLSAMGYTKPWKEKVLEKALVGYGRILTKVRLGETLRNRGAKSTEIQRRYKKLCGNTGWFRDELETGECTESEDTSQRQKRWRKAQNQRRVESVMFIPLTKGSELKQRLNEMECNIPFKSKFKYQEVTGTSILGALNRQDPWGEHCGRINCFNCQTKTWQCTKQGIVYEITCQVCKSKEVTSSYFGESARTSFDRGLEHLMALRRMNKESPLVEHHLEEHPQQEPEFSMKVLKFIPKPLERQCQEAVLIDEYQGMKIMNRRGEWGQNLPPKLTLEDNQAQGKRKVPKNMQTDDSKRMRLESGEEDVGGPRVGPTELDPEPSTHQGEGLDTRNTPSRAKKGKIRDRIVEKIKSKKKEPQPTKSQSKHLKARDILKFMQATPRSQKEVQLIIENPDLSAPEKGQIFCKGNESIGANMAKPISRSEDNLDLLSSTWNLRESLDQRSQIIEPNREIKRVRVNPHEEEINTTREDPSVIVKTNLDTGGGAITNPTEEGEVQGVSVPPGSAEIDFGKVKGAEKLPRKQALGVQRFAQTPVKKS